MCTRAVTGLSALALATVLAACGPTDATIRERVDSALAADDSVGAVRFAIDSRDRSITLSGTVTAQAMRQRAVAVAKATTGVTDVIDRIVVVPPPATATDSNAAVGPMAPGGAGGRRPGHM